MNTSFCATSKLTSGGIPRSVHFFSAFFESTVVSLDKPFVFRYFRYLFKQHRSQSRYILCHGQFRFHILLSLLDKVFFGGKIIFIPHGSLDPYLFTNQRFLKVLYFLFVFRPFSSSIDRIIFSTNSERSKSLALFPYLSRINSSIVHWSVGLIPVPSHSERLCSRSSLNIPFDSVVFLAYGRLCHMKRFLSTIDLFSSLLKRSSFPLHLIIFGPSSDYDHDFLKSYCADLMVSDYVSIYDFVDPHEDPVYLHASDYYLSLSHRENFNRALVESMSSSLLPILSTGNDLSSDLPQDILYTLSESDIIQIKDYDCSPLLEWVLDHRDPLDRLRLLSSSFAAHNFSYKSFKNRLASIFTL